MPKEVTIAPARKTYGGPWSKITGIPVTREMLKAIGQCLVDELSRESKKDFSKRGWSGKDPGGGPRIWDSFSYDILGASTLVLKTSFYGMARLIRGDIPPRKMTWLTQEGKDMAPARYRKTPTERWSKGGGARPLVVPMQDRNSGMVIFRTAPLTMSEAWVHPGIAKFTFFERALRKGREKCAGIVGQEAARFLMTRDMTR